MKTFEELELIEPVQRALADQNYRIPTPIQAQSIPAALEGRDVLGCAQTGTGKTAAFALPIVNWLGEINLKAIPKCPAALVLAPTRELAIQIGESFKSYSQHLRVNVALIYGGVSQVSQVRNLNRGAHVIVATPGRLLDLMQQKHIDLKFLKRFVLDEADQMLNMGFLPDLRKIIKCLPPKRQSMFFSATLPPKILELSGQLLKNPVHVDVTPKTTSVKKIDQSVLFLEKSSKMPMLKKIIGGEEVERVLVFTRTKRGANLVAKKLDQNGISSAAIHGNKSQNARVKALESFRRNDIQVLVATDIAARGIDIDGITHVLNYDMPVEAESYVHRIGRTGRAGATGIAVSFCTADEHSELRDIEKLIGKKVPVNKLSGEVLPRESEGGSQRGRRSATGRGTENRTGSRAGSSSRKRSGNRSGGAKQSSNRASDQSRRSGSPKASGGTKPRRQKSASQPASQSASQSPKSPRGRTQDDSSSRSSSTRSRGATSPRNAAPSRGKTPARSAAASRSAAPTGVYFSADDSFDASNTSAANENKKPKKRRRRGKNSPGASVR